jgi:hypothetical protein
MAFPRPKGIPTSSSPTLNFFLSCRTYAPAGIRETSGRRPEKGSDGYRTLGHWVESTLANRVIRVHAYCGGDAWTASCTALTKSLGGPDSNPRIVLLLPTRTHRVANVFWRESSVSCSSRYTQFDWKKLLVIWSNLFEALAAGFPIAYIFVINTLSNQKKCQWLSINFI